MDWALFAGLIGIAIAIYFGLWGFRKDISDKLSDVRDKVMSIGITLDKAWDLIKMHYGATSGTVVRNLKNLGSTKITARPEQDITSYLIEIEKPLLQDGLIIKLSKVTDLEKEERRLFGNRIPQVATPLGTRLLVKVPCTEPKLCTEYISLLLKWLDSTYFEALPKIKEFEESIQV